MLVKIGKHRIRVFMIKQKTQYQPGNDWRFFNIIYQVFSQLIDPVISNV